MNNELNQMPIPTTDVGFTTFENTTNSQSMPSEMAFQQQKKSYTLRKLKATELFPMLNILKKVGLKKFTEILQNKSIKDTFTKLKNGESIEDDDVIGIGSIVFELLEVVLDGATHCENEYFTILANVSGKTVEDIKNLDIDVLILMTVELVKNNMGFIKDVSKLLR